MICFLDTSALFKLYHKEDFSDGLRSFLKPEAIDALAISVLATVEFCSTAWRKVRSNQKDAALFTETTAGSVISTFESDQDLYQIIPFEKEDFDGTKRLLNRISGRQRKLRSLDAMQLYTALKLKGVLDYFICFDKDLAEAASFIGLSVLGMDPLSSGMPDFK